MKHRPTESTPPPDSRIAHRLAGASFHDAWSIPSSDTASPALAHFIAAARRTPRWIDRCMAARNRVGGLVGLKDLGTLSGVAPGKPAEAYRPGERVGIFTVIDNTFDEALIGDEDKHLRVVLSVHRQARPGTGQVTITITTVVHVKNLLGTLYMLPVKPMHRLIAPAVLATIANPAPGGHATPAPPPSRRPEGLEIRRATVQDIPQIFDIRTSVRENHLSLEELAQLGITPDTLPGMLQGHGRGWVAVDQGVPVAFAMADADEATVFALFVRASHENRGLGRQLMQAAQAWLQAQGCTDLWLVTDADRQVRANGFYRHLGWTDDGLQDDGQVRFRKSLR